MNKIQKLPYIYKFHHIGCATTSIELEREYFESLGYQVEGDSFVDTVQGVAGCFITGPGPRLELLENLPGSKTLTPWLNSGTKMYHFAYLVTNMEAATAWVLSQRARIIVEPVPAVAFRDRRISFAIFRNKLMLEFIEKDLTGTDLIQGAL